MNLKLYISCFLLICFFTTCKKKDTQTPEIIYNTVPNEYDIHLSSVLNYIKTPTGGYDTLVSLSGWCGRKYVKANQWVTLSEATITCNGSELKSNFNPTNKLSYLMPASNWSLFCASDPISIAYSDTSSIPSFTNSNWFHSDSAYKNSTIILDFSSFKNYTSIYAFIDDKFYSINYPQSSISFSLDYYWIQQSERRFLNIRAIKTSYYNGDKKKYIFNKELHFEFPIKIYN